MGSKKMVKQIDGSSAASAQHGAGWLSLMVSGRSQDELLESG